MSKFVDYPTVKIVEWLEERKWPWAPRRAWKKFTDWASERYGDFAELTGGGGFSGSPKLLATIEVLRHLKENGELNRVSTVGEALAYAKDKQLALGFLPPVDHAVTMAKLAGRDDIASQLTDAGF